MRDRSHARRRPRGVGPGDARRASGAFRPPSDGRRQVLLDGGARGCATMAAGAGRGMRSPRLWSTRVSLFARSTLSAAVAVAVGDGPDCGSRRFLVAACSCAGGSGLIAVRSTRGPCRRQAHPPSRRRQRCPRGGRRRLQPRAEQRRHEARAPAGRAAATRSISRCVDVPCKSRSPPNDALIRLRSMYAVRRDRQGDGWSVGKGARPHSPHAHAFALRLCPRAAERFAC